MPALPPSVLEPLWVQVAALLPTRQVHHPLGCHRPRIPGYLDNPLRQNMFRAGHAHPGVWLVLGLVGMLYVDQTPLSDGPLCQRLVRQVLAANH